MIDSKDTSEKFVSNNNNTNPNNNNNNNYDSTTTIKQDSSPWPTPMNQYSAEDVLWHIRRINKFECKEAYEGMQQLQTRLSTNPEQFFIENYQNEKLKNEKNKLKNNNSNNGNKNQKNTDTETQQEETAELLQRAADFYTACSISALHPDSRECFPSPDELSKKAFGSGLEFLDSVTPELESKIQHCINNHHSALETLKATLGVHSRVASDPNSFISRYVKQAKQHFNDPEVNLMLRDDDSTTQNKIQKAENEYCEQEKLALEKCVNQTVEKQGENTLDLESCFMERDRLNLCKTSTLCSTALSLCMSMEAKYNPLSVDGMSVLHCYDSSQQVNHCKQRWN